MISNHYNKHLVGSGLPHSCSICTGPTETSKKPRQPSKKPKKTIQAKAMNLKIQPREEEKKLNSRKNQEKPLKKFSGSKKSKDSNPVAKKIIKKGSISVRPKKKKLSIDMNRNMPNPNTSEIYENNILSDSFNRFPGDFQDSVFNPYLPTQNMLYEEVFDRLTVNRVSRNLFNLFFDSLPGLSSIEYNPATLIFWNETNSFSIGQLLNQLVAMNPETTNPVDPAFISRIPVVKTTLAVLRQNPACPICQEDFSLGEYLKKLYCGHCYHTDCITPWMQAKNTCPVCREIIN
jgi:ribosomal protein S27AE